MRVRRCPDALGSRGHPRNRPKAKQRRGGREGFQGMKPSLGGAPPLGVHVLVEELSELHLNVREQARVQTQSLYVDSRNNMLYW